MGVIFSSLSVPTLCVSLAHDLDGNAWDAQIERDAADGQLDRLALQALADCYAAEANPSYAGQQTPCPPKTVPSFRPRDF